MINVSFFFKTQHLEEGQHISLHIFSEFDDTRQQLIARIIRSRLKSYLCISLSAALGNI